MSVQFKEDPKNKVVYAKIENLGKITSRSIRQGFFMLGKDLKRTANKNILSKPKGGKVYIARTRSGRRRRHRASAPGESHANRSGMLRRSLGWKVNGSKSMEFGYGVDKPAPDYGKFVEDGTFKMKPRPSLAIAVKQTNRNSELYVGQMFEKLTR